MPALRLLEPIALVGLAVTIAACGEESTGRPSSTGTGTSATTGASTTGTSTTTGGTGAGTTSTTSEPTDTGTDTGTGTSADTDTTTEATNTGATTGTTDTGTSTGTTGTGTSTATSGTGTSTGTSGTGTSTGTSSGGLCGNGDLDPGEDCDDGNGTNSDGCDNDCTVSEGAKTVVAGGEHTCALFHTGAVRCWGNGAGGRLGYGNEDNIGDTETPASTTDLSLGGPATQIAAGGGHTCAILEGGTVRCWGIGALGRLGYGDEANIGDTETPDTVGPVAIGGTALEITAGDEHTCVLLQGGSVRCWGNGLSGRLGYGAIDNIGDGETPDSVPVVDLGAGATDVVAGGEHTCAILVGGLVRCWGEGSYGRLGYVDTADIGDDELPSTVGPVVVGATVHQLAAGDAHTCALIDGGGVRCWGYGGGGRLGYVSVANIGDTETPESAGNVDLGGAAIQISAGDAHNCAVLQGGAVRCWGYGLHGRLGYGDTANIGDTETPASADDVSVGGTVTDVAGGGEHTCARLDQSAVRCWGRSNFGQLGYGNMDTIGDNELPSSIGEVPLY